MKGSKMKWQWQLEEHKVFKTICLVVRVTCPVATRCLSFGNKRNTRSTSIDIILVSFLLSLKIFSVCQNLNIFEHISLTLNKYLAAENSLIKQIFPLTPTKHVYGDKSKFQTFFQNQCFITGFLIYPWIITKLLVLMFSLGIVKDQWFQGV